MELKNRKYLFNNVGIICKKHEQIMKSAVLVSESNNLPLPFANNQDE